jgi:hypothetical protein
MTLKLRRPSPDESPLSPDEVAFGLERGLIARHAWEGAADAPRSKG